MIADVCAQSNHSLYWGVEEGEEFVYALQRKLILNPTQEQLVTPQIPLVEYLDEGQKLTARVSDLEDVPTLINESTDIPLGFVTLIRENDSQLVPIDPLQFVVPIGDWNLLTEMSGFTSTEGLRLIDTDSEWGYTSSGSFSSAGTVISFHAELRYEKENGTLTYLRLRYSALGSDLIDIVFAQWHSGMPTILPPELQLTTVLILATALIFGTIIAVGVYRWYKSKKPIIQQLGE
jgi:hypothetical protein